MNNLNTPVAKAPIAQLLQILQAADDVELKLAVPDSDQRSAVTALDMDVLEAELRQVVFFDTPDLRLNRAGVVVRARRTRKGGDTVVKLRPVVPTDLPPKLRRTNGFKVELDAMPGSFVCSGSLKGKVDNADVRDVIQGRRPIRKLFSSAQRTLYAAHAPKGLDLDSLTPLGPINLVKSKFAVGGRAAVAELWFYPDASRMLELSMKCAPEKALRVAAEARAFLAGLGINPTGAQETKTRKALQYFSRLNSSHRQA
jgi:hypothetical protein